MLIVHKRDTSYLKQWLSFTTTIPCNLTDLTLPRISKLPLFSLTLSRTLPPLLASIRLNAKQVERTNFFGVKSRVFYLDPVITALNLARFSFSFFLRPSPRWPDLFSNEFVLSLPLPYLLLMAAHIPSVKILRSEHATMNGALPVARISSWPLLISISPRIPAFSVVVS